MDELLQRAVRCLEVIEGWIDDHTKDDRIEGDAHTDVLAKWREATDLFLRDAKGFEDVTIVPVRRGGWTDIIPNEQWKRKE